MNILMNLSTSFTAVAVISSIMALYPTFIATGGPGVVLWSWIGVSILTCFSGLSLSEIGSRYPSVILYFIIGWKCLLLERGNGE